MRNKSFKTFSYGILNLLITVLGIGFPLFFPSILYPYDLDKRVLFFTLKNGLRVLMMERHLSPTASIYIHYRAGAVDEADGKTGTAHLLEHMMFKGTKTIGTRNYLREERILRQIDKVGTLLDLEKKKGKAGNQAILDRLALRLQTLQKKQRYLAISNEIDRLYTENGAIGLNASTGQDLTTYQVSLPANRIELWVRIESDRMANPVFREFYTERDVVMEERRQRSESDPGGKLLELYFAAAYIAHPYRRPILGWTSDMITLNISYMISFFRETHSPNNTVIAVVGDIQPKAVLKIIEKYCGSLSAKRLFNTPATVEPQQSGEKRIEVVFDAEPQMIMGYHKPPPPATIDYAFDVMEAILARGRTSRLFKTLIDEKRIAESIHAINGLPGSRYPNQFVVFATPRHPYTLIDLELAIDMVIESLKTEPVPDTELDKAKNQLRAAFIRSLDSNAGLAGMLSYYEALLGDFRYLTRYIEAIDRVTSEDILYAARTYLSKDNRTIARLIRKPKP